MQVVRGVAAKDANELFSILKKLINEFINYLSN